MKRLIRVRKRYSVFGRGDIQILETQNRKVLAYLRSYADQTVLIVNNLSRFIQPVELDLAEFAGMRLVELIGETPFPAIATTPYFLSLAPHGFIWFRIEGVRLALDDA